MTDPIFNFCTFTPSLKPMQLACFSGQTNRMAFYNPDTSAVVVYSLNDQKLMFSFNDFQQLPTSLAFSKNEVILAIGLDSGTIRLYDLQQGQLIKAFAAHRTAVSALSVTINNSFLASAALDGQVRFWEMKTQQLLQDINTITGSVNGRMTTESTDPEVTELMFNHQSTWLFIGNASGKVLIWSLQKMQYIAEFLLGKSIKQIHSHAVNKLACISTTQQSYIIELDQFQIIKKLSRPYIRVFSPMKNNLLVGVRNNGMDVLDVNSDNVLVESVEGQFKSAQVCAERKTSSVPQILVLQIASDGQISIDVCNLKVIKSFSPDQPEETETLKPGGQIANKQFEHKSEYKIPAPKSVPKEPSKSTEFGDVKHAKTPKFDNQELNQFMLGHRRRQKLLYDRVLIAKQIDATMPLESAIELGDLPMFLSIYQQYPVAKVSLQVATAVVRFLTTQIQLAQTLTPEAIQQSCQITSKLTIAFKQVVKDAGFIMNNPRRDIASEERATRAVEFKQAVEEFAGSARFAAQSVEGAAGFALGKVVDDLKGAF